MNFSLIQGYPTQCPVCSNEYDQSDGMETIAQNQGGSILHFFCHHCETALLVSIRVNASGMVGMGMLTDLTRKEAKSFLSQKSAISGDEILSLYSAFKNSQVGVKDLFV
ncbi:MAG: hypothetical protein IPN70_01785 [Candidatus Moraniibacteriota bacterium]|nr:MAG: hypothetical protein IPN70_01785 [Candidatus Moranbacteria bacterium]